MCIGEKYVHHRDRWYWLLGWSLFSWESLFSRYYNFENYNVGIKTALGYNIIVMCVTIIQQIESNYNIKIDRIEL